MADNFFSDLKRAREEKGVSLEEISDATLINLKMLQALERGDTKSLPQAYVRAFLREYAALVGFDKNETMQKYDAWLKSTGEPTAQSINIPVPSPLPEEKAKPEIVEPVVNAPQSRSTAEWLVPTLFKIALAIGVLVLLNVVFWNWLEKEPSVPTKETPFLDVVKDQQERRGMADSSVVTDTTKRVTSAFRSTPDSSKLQQRQFIPPPVPGPGDSMTLVGTATDTVWMEVVLDDDILTEHLLPPGTTLFWRAQNEFWISAIGNPLGMRLSLNGKPIAIPYRKGYVTRDLRITRDSLVTR